MREMEERVLRRLSYRPWMLLKISMAFNEENEAIVLRPLHVLHVLLEEKGTVSITCSLQIAQTFNVFSYFQSPNELNRLYLSLCELLSTLQFADIEQQRVRKILRRHGWINVLLDIAAKDFF